MRLKPFRFSNLVLAVFLTIFPSVGFAHTPPFTKSFMREDCTFAHTGSNPYFILEPGYQLILQGQDDGSTVRVEITVLNETQVVDGVETRVVEERETEDGELIEVSRNFYAICAPHNSVFYFGEEVDIYNNGNIVSHDGAWRSGLEGAKAGVIMPGINLIGAKYFQEIAPGIAMDRAEITSLTKALETPAGVFSGVMKVVETTPLEPGHTSIKFYAPGVGLIKDGKIKLISAQFIS